MLWLTQIDYWHWWLLAGMFLILELASPRFLFLWLGILASGIGFLVFAFPALPFFIQALAFAVLSMVVTLAWRRFRET